MASPLGIKIRTERKKLKLTLDELATLTESSKSYMWELENKDDINPTAEKVSRIANALKVPVEYLLDDDKEDLTSLDASNVFFRRFEKLDASKQAALNTLLEMLERESKP